MPLLKETGASEKTLRVVAIGGGTGLSTLLRGLKRYVATPDRRKGVRLTVDGPLIAPCPVLPCAIRELSAVVTVTDDGGSSGRLREDFKMLPPGDIRNCLVALSRTNTCCRSCFNIASAKASCRDIALAISSSPRFQTLRETLHRQYRCRRKSSRHGEKSFLRRTQM